MRDFYGEVIGLPVAATSPTTLAIQAGTSRIEFAQVDDGSRPFYHFAFTIPQNKLPAAKDWLAQRAALLRGEGQPDGDDQFHFSAWNADSIYFHDPAGNIVEFIARHTLNNAAGGAFTPQDLLCVSEISIVVPARPAAVSSVVPYIDGRLSRTQLDHQRAVQPRARDDRSLTVAAR
jgi:hypothetical protein